MSKKKNKFDLTHLVQTGYLKEGQTLFFVSDPKKFCKVTKQPNGDFKVCFSNETLTVHAVVQKWLGTEAPDHASKWIRDEKGKSLFDYWHADDLSEAA